MKRTSFLAIFFFYIAACNLQRNERITEHPSQETTDSVDVLILKYKEFFPDTNKIFENSKELFDYLRPKKNVFFALKNAAEIPIYKDKSDTALYLKEVYSAFEDALVMKHALRFFGTEDCLNILAANAPRATNEKIELFDRLPDSIKESHAGKNTRGILLKHALKNNIGLNVIEKLFGSVVTPNNEAIAFTEIFSNRRNNVILVVGASWCGPCVEQERQLKKMFPNIDTTQVSVIGLSIEDSQQSFSKFAQQEKFPWPYYRIRDDGVGLMENIFGRSGVPVNFLLDSEGKVRAESKFIFDLFPLVNIEVPIIYRRRL